MPPKLRSQTAAASEHEEEELLVNNENHSEELLVNNENHPEEKQVEDEVEQEKAEPPPPPAAAAVQEADKNPKSKKPKTTFSSAKRPTKVKPKNPHLGGEGEQENDKNTKPKEPKTSLTPAKRPTGEKTQIVVEEVEERKKKKKKIWSEEEEMGILKKLLKLKDKGLDDDELLGCIKNSVHLVDVTDDQLSKKIGSMRKAYSNNSLKEKNGEKLTFSNTHDAKLYELIEKIWCPANRMEAEKNGVGVDLVVEKEQEKEEQNLFHSMNEFLQWGKGNVLIKPPGSIVNANKAKVLQRKWEKLQINEAKVYLERLELMKSCTKVVLDSLESSSSN